MSFAFLHFSFCIQIIFKEVISSSMALFQTFSSYESTASLTVLGSSSVIDKAKFEQKLDGLYLFDSLLSRSDLLNTGV